MKTPLRRRLTKRRKCVKQVAMLLHPGAVEQRAGMSTSHRRPELNAPLATQERKRIAQDTISQGEKNGSEKARLMEEKERVAETPSGQQTTVYCEGLSYEATESDVVTFFTPLEVKEVRMPRYQDSGKPRGYAHVEFWRESDAATALSRDRQSLKGRYVTLQPARDKATVVRDRPRPQGCRTVFVKNLPYDTNEDAVRNVFNRFGKVEDVRLPNWQHTKRLKGHGYVQFIKEYNAELAFKQQHTIRLKGRELRVDYAEEQRPRASFRTPNGNPWVKTKVGKRITRHSHTSSVQARN